MATAIVTSLLSFFLVSIVGAFLAQKWQRISWAKQQTFLGREKEYEALKSLSDEIAKLSAKRVYASQHMLGMISDDDAGRFEQAASQYATVVRDWNDNLQSFYVRLTFYATYSPFVYVLENRIHKRFYEIGARLESGIRLRRKTGNKPARDADLAAALNLIQGSLFNFNRDLVKLLEHRRREIYYGVKIPYDKYNINKLTTIELLQLLFKPRIDIYGVFRASFDLPPPGFRGYLGTGIDK